jgi:hypothetical protein
MNNSEDFPTLPTYQAAVEHYESRTPYKRGRNKGLRPLGFVRRYDRSQIRMEGNVVVCRYYNTDVIRFLPDNTIVLDHGGHQTPSTAEMINFVLHQRWNTKPWEGAVQKIRGKFYLRDIKDPKVNHRFDKPITITSDNVVCGGGVEFKQVLNQKLMGQIRKYYADSGFMEMVQYIVQMNPVMRRDDFDKNGRPNLDVSKLTNYFANKAMQNREDFFDELNEAIGVKDEQKRLELYLPLAEQLVLSSSLYHWDRGSQQYIFLNDFKKARELFYDLCRFQYSTVLFKSEMVEQGNILRDDNIRYVEFGSAGYALPFEVETI